MFSILEPLKGEKFDNFIAFLIENSDSFLFHLPNFEKIMVNERNAKMMKEYPIGYSYEDDPENYNKYLQKMEKYLSIIKDDITAQYYDTGYLNQITSNEMKVFEVNISNNSPLFFSQARDFSMWMYPFLPEDPCFLYKGKCVYQTITHENLYFLYLKGKRIERFLIQNNIPFEHVPFSRRPSINRQ